MLEFHGNSRLGGWALLAVLAFDFSLSIQSQLPICRCSIFSGLPPFSSFCRSIYFLVCYDPHPIVFPSEKTRSPRMGKCGSIGYIHIGLLRDMGNPYKWK